MSDVMPIEQAEFIDTLQSWFNQSTNMCHEDCYNLAFIIWQHKDYLSKMLGYEKGRTEAIDEFALKLVQWKPQNEEYMSFRDVVFQIAEQLKEQNIK